MNESTRALMFLAVCSLALGSMFELGCGSGSPRTSDDAGVAFDATMPDAAVEMDASFPLPGNPLPDGTSDCVGDPITLDPVGSLDRWSFGDSGSGFMHPGGDCIGCHSTRRAPRFTVAGTVMDAWHEPDDCFGTDGVLVEITGADGVVTFLHTNATGNFSSRASIALPYTVKLTGPDGATREMFTAQTDLDCAHCHTQAGANGAPGRIGRP